MPIRWKDIKITLYRPAEVLGIFNLRFRMSSIFKELGERLLSDVKSSPRLESVNDGIVSGGQNICLFASFSRSGQLEPYLKHYLKALRDDLKCDIIFATTSVLPDTDIEWLKTVCLKVVLRENRGYDFGSWQVGFKLLPNLMRYENLFLANDSVYGPFFSLEPILSTLKTEVPTMIGITESLAVKPHLQSYFIGFNRAAFSLPFFHRFWSGLRFFKDKYVVIYNYEIGLTVAARRAGCQIKALYPYRVVQSFAESQFQIPRRFARRVYINPTHVFWESLFLLKSPFLKTDLLRNNAWDVDLSRLNERVSNSAYPTNLIQSAWLNPAGKG